MTTMLAESGGGLTITLSGDRLDELAFRSAARIVDSGEALIVVDAAGCFEPRRMTHYARSGGLDPAGLMKHLHILRPRSPAGLEDLIVKHLEFAVEQFGTRHILIPDLLAPLYDPAIFTRDAAHILGRIKTKLEELAEGGAEIVIICRPAAADLGTRSHFLSSLRASAERVYLRSST